MKLLNNIRKRLAAAIHGPWFYCELHNEIHGRGSCAGQVSVCAPPSINGKFDINDAILIASCPQDLATLIEIVEIQQQALQNIADYMGDAAQDHAEEALERVRKLGEA